MLKSWIMQKIINHANIDEPAISFNMNELVVWRIGQHHHYFNIPGIN